MRSVKPIVPLHSMDSEIPFRRTECLANGHAVCESKYRTMGLFDAPRRSLQVDAMAKSIVRSRLRPDRGRITALSAGSNGNANGKTWVEDYQIVFAGS